MNHDFLGDADYTASLNDVTRDFSHGLGTTWCSCGVGAQLKTSANLNFYGSLERSNGSEYQEDYRCTLGVRHTF